jgi:hypothetical protein
MSEDSEDEAPVAVTGVTFVSFEWKQVAGVCIEVTESKAFVGFRDNLDNISAWRHHM